MAFIVCVIGPGKMDLIYKIQNYVAFHIDTVAIDGQLCFPDGRFLGINHTQSYETAY